MDKTFTRLLLVFFLAFVMFTSFVFFNKPLTRLTRANEEGKPSPRTSLIFAWPLRNKADGITPSEIQVFSRNRDGKALSDKPVQLVTSVGEVKEDTVTTDAQGKATFHLISNKPGVAEIKAIIDNIEIENSVSVKFE
jgi:hypothetical protein